ncbi:MAG: 3-dehydroquinate synthase [Proteobacteria bacterium]|nr:3-dehydroquinate synthase [Pseudomonadota bacterium]
MDQNVYRLHLQGLRIDPDRLFLLEATEEFKSLGLGVVAVVDWLARLGLTKTDCVIVIGGGITQDVGGFACHLFKRGIPWAFYPTTLLSMCDSCIGGKAGVNHRDAKNQLALFSAPREVCINPGFLNTLPEEEVRSGLGEVLKLHLIGGPRFFERYQELLSRAGSGIPRGSILHDLIWGSLLIKRAVIERDEFELNLRRSLNYGHTFGHAIESLTSFGIPHGKAVAIGMWVVNQLAVDEGLFSVTEHDAVTRAIKCLLDPHDLRQLASIDPKQLGAVLSTDKKNTGSKLNLVVPHQIGSTGFLPVENSETLWARVCGILSRLET